MLKHLLNETRVPVEIPKAGKFATRDPRAKELEDSPVLELLGDEWAAGKVWSGGTPGWHCRAQKDWEAEIRWGITGSDESWSSGNSGRAEGHQRWADCDEGGGSHDKGRTQDFQQRTTAAAGNAYSPVGSPASQECPADSTQREVVPCGGWGRTADFSCLNRPGIWEERRATGLWGDWGVGLIFIQ